MENLNIQDLWKQNEQALEESQQLNTKLLREIKIDKAKKTLKQLLFLPISSLLFHSVLASYALYFLYTHWGVWYFMVAGGAISYFSTWYGINAINQIKRIVSIDYEIPVIKLQKELSQLKMAVVRNLRIAAWLLPFAPFIALFIFKVFFDVNLMTVLNYNMIVSFGIVTIILEIISLFILKMLRPKNLNKKWLNWLLQGNGSQVDEALQFLEHVKTFETE